MIKLTKPRNKLSLLVLTAVLITSSLFAQNREKIYVYSKAEAKYYNVHWFADLNVGTRMFGATSSEANLGPGLNVNAGIGYLFTERFGIKGRLD